jgi:c-di-GMP-binding flagellar brake protein YcgR
MSTAQIPQDMAGSPTGEPLLAINDRLQITVGGTDEEVPTTYLSRVENIAGEEYTIGWPTSRGIRAPVREDDVLTLSYACANAVYSFDARIVQRILEPIALVVVCPQGPPRKIQRREDVRVPALVEVRLSARVVSVNPDRPKDLNFIACRTVNLSGGGFAIHHAAAPLVGSIYQVRLAIPGQSEPVEMTAKVVRCESVMDPARGMHYEVGFAFIQVRESSRRHIVSFVFRFQQSTPSQQ